MKERLIIEFEKFDRIGVEKPRSFYIPFAEDDQIREQFGIVDRLSSSEMISLKCGKKIIVNLNFHTP